MRFDRKPSKKVADGETFAIKASKERTFGGKEEKESKIRKFDVYQMPPQFIKNER